MEPGARVGRQGERFKIEPPDAPATSIPVRQVSDIILHSFAQISAQALRTCADHDIPVFWVAQTGDVIGTFAPGGGRVQRRIRQYEALRDVDRRLHLARSLVKARVEGQVRFLLRATRGVPERREPVVPAIRGIGDVLKRILQYGDADALRGGEGRATAHYFGALPNLLRSELQPAFSFEGRNRRPPRDRINALLSFGYGMVYRTVLQAILVVGLEPAFGFYHTPRSSAQPLALDLMEMFRIPLWDMPLVGATNRGQWDPDADFEVTREHVWLSKAGRKKAIEVYERRLAEEWKHPVTRYSLSYARLVELEVRLLEKEWSGEGGLFARFRLR
ncbi:MAG: type I-MYXAN CRISPR-associated endonuclease Cas1 [Polyangiaceae bacterium]